MSDEEKSKPSVSENYLLLRTLIRGIIFLLITLLVCISMYNSHKNYLRVSAIENGIDPYKLRMAIDGYNDNVDPNLMLQEIIKGQIMNKSMEAMKGGN